MEERNDKSLILEKIMKKYACLIIAVLGLLPTYGLALTIPDEQLKADAVSYCPPSRIRYEDLPRAPTQEMVDRMPKYYISQLIGLKEEPPYEAFKNPLASREEIADFSYKMAQLVDGNDMCDKSAILYIARFYKYFCPDAGYKNYKELDSESKKYVEFFFDFPGEIFQRARSVSGCNFEMLNNLSSI